MLARMIVSGANHLYNNKNTVDELNIFPVPDGDTGTNMSMTANAVAAALNEHISSSVTKVADTASYAALRGARGNSGVILSQFFRGIARSLKGKGECTAQELAAALAEGSAAAYKAVMNPTEGTVLTVAREAANGAVKKAQTEEDIVPVMEKAVARGSKALAMTTEMLPVLKKAGVVDAGGQGWIFFLEGALYYLKTGAVTESDRTAQTARTERAGTAQAEADTKSIKFMYCTEFIVEKSSASVNTAVFKKAIETKGDCMLVIDDDEIVKVHIHTNNPGYVIEKALLMGQLINIKIDNMKHQHQSIINAEEEKKPEPPAEKKKIGVAAVCDGDGMRDILINLGADEIISGGQTMNPSTEDILAAVEKINAETVFIFPNNKNIIMAAEQAARISEGKIIVIPTRSIPQCVSALLKLSEAKTPEQNKEAMERAIKNVATGQVTFAVRDTENDGEKIEKGDILGLSEGKITAVGKNTAEVCRKIAEDIADEDTEFITLYYGKDTAEEDAEALAEEIEELLPDCEVSVKYGGQSLYYYIISAE